MGCDPVVGLRMVRRSTCFVGKHRGRASECSEVERVAVAARAEAFRFPLEAEANVGVIMKMEVTRTHAHARRPARFTADLTLLVGQAARGRALGWLVTRTHARRHVRGLPPI